MDSQKVEKNIYREVLCTLHPVHPGCDTIMQYQVCQAGIKNL